MYMSTRANLDYWSTDNCCVRWSLRTGACTIGAFSLVWQSVMLTAGIMMLVQCPLDPHPTILDLGPTNLTTVFPEPTNLTNVIPEPTNLTTVFPEPTNLTNVIPEPINLTTVFPEPTNFTKVIPEPTNLTTVFPEPTNLTNVIPELTNLTTVFPEPTNLTTVFPKPTNLTTVIPEPTNVIPEPTNLTTAFPEPTNLTLVFSEPTNLTTVFPKPTNLTPVFPEPTNLTTVIPEHTNLTTVFPEPTNLTPVFPEPTNLTTVFPEPTNLTTHAPREHTNIVSPVEESGGCVSESQDDTANSQLVSEGNSSNNSNSNSSNSSSSSSSSTFSCPWLPEPETEILGVKDEDTLRLVAGIFVTYSGIYTILSFSVVLGTIKKSVVLLQGWVAFTSLHNILILAFLLVPLPFTTLPHLLFSIMHFVASLYMWAVVKSYMHTIKVEKKNSLIPEDAITDFSVDGVDVTEIPVEV